MIRRTKDGLLVDVCRRKEGRDRQRGNDDEVAVERGFRSSPTTAAAES
jgi:hypothetical protein